MFITLKNGSQDKGQGMEQVASRTAGPARRIGRNRHPVARARPSCLTCQSKKLICTGRMRECDRCLSRSLACIYPSRAASEREESSSSSSYEFQSMSDDPPSWLPAATSATGQLGFPAELQSSLPAHVPSHFTGVAHIHGDVPDESGVDGFAGTILRIAHTNGDFYSDAFAINEPVARDMFAGDYSSVSSSGIDQRALAPAIMNPQTQPHQQQPHQQQQQQEQQQEQGEEIPEDQDDGEDREDGEEGESQGSSSHSGPNNRTPDRAETSLCSCLHEVLQVIEHLDEDHYRITTLSLDQVLQLQKRLIALCDKTLSCVTCNELSTIHSVIVIICDRLTEIFECIHKRIRRMNLALKNASGSRSPDPSLATASSSSSGAGDRGPGQLFCGTTGQMASSAPCNLALFLPDIQDVFSTEEQLHMVMALLKLQISSFQNLLMRLGDLAQVSSSEARRSKVDSMKTRLAGAASDITIELKQTAQILSR